VLIENSIEADNVDAFQAEAIAKSTAVKTAGPTSTRGKVKKPDHPPSHTDGLAAPLPGPATTTDTAIELYKWIQARYLDSAFTKVGFIGWSKFQQALQKERPQQSSQVGPAITM